jgi:LmbE family N-acetylglucosaminyl deacetylase
MLPVSLTGLSEVLFLGAHCDDVEIGCGGTLVALARSQPQVKLRIAVFSGDALRAAETRAAISGLLPSGAQYELDILAFRDGFFPVEWTQIKEQFELLKSRCKPDVIFTHFGDDKHQDHRVLSELTWNTFRNHTIFEYEIPKYDGDLGRPQLYVPLTEDIVRHKSVTLLRSFPSQANKRWFTEELFRSLLRLRGMECNSASGYAEAFYARKWTAIW